MPTEKIRTEMVHVYAPLGGAPRLEFIRPVVRTYEDNAEIKVPDSDRRIMVEHVEIANEPLPGGPVTISTYGELVALLLDGAAADIEARADAKIEKQNQEKRAMLERYLQEKAGRTTGRPTTSEGKP